MLLQRTTRPCHYRSPAREVLSKAPHATAPHRAAVLWQCTTASQRAGVSSVAARSSKHEREPHFTTSQQAYLPSAEVQPMRVYSFDPVNPNHVREEMVQPHAELHVVDEIVQQVHEEHGLEVTIPPSADDPGVTRPLLPMPARIGQIVMHRLQSMTHIRDTSDKEVRLQRSQMVERQLLAQLEQEQQKVGYLQQYEGMYKEWRMKCESQAADIALMQRVLAERDAELARSKQLLEASAAEQARLAAAYQAAQSKAVQLELDLEQTQLLQAAAAQALLPEMAGVYAGYSNGSGNGAVPFGSSNGVYSNGNGSVGYSNGKSNGVYSHSNGAYTNGSGTHSGNGGSNGSSHTPQQVSSAITGMQTMLEELSRMAKGLAREMHYEVAEVEQGPPLAPPRAPTPARAASPRAPSQHQGAAARY